MTTTVQTTSATIYQFPARGRFAVSAQTAANGEALSSVRAPSISFGSWYHDEAIEAERASKN